MKGILICINVYLEKVRCPILSAILYYIFLSNLENQSSCDLCQFFFETDIENSKQDIRKNGGPHSAMFCSFT